MTSAVRRWEFPKSAGGGIVIATFPVNFINGVHGSDPAMAVDTLRPSPRAPAPTIPTTVWDAAVPILRDNTALASRVAKIAETVGAPKEERPALLAWWLVEHHLRAARLPTAGYLVIATLLKEAGLPDDAVRILSEAAPVDPGHVVAAFNRWGQTEDAKRVECLQKRGGT